MPRNLTYIICAVAVAALVSGVYFIREAQRSAMTESDTALLFPNLRGVLNEVTRIEGRTEDGPYTLKHESGAWRLVERGDYPASGTRVNRMLLGLAQITLVDEVESTLDEKNTDVFYVALKDRSGKTIASALVEETQTLTGEDGERQIHVRTPADSQVWLGAASIPKIASKVDWLDNELLRIDDGRIAQVTVHYADGEQVRVVRTPGQKRFYALDTNALETKASGLSAYDEHAVRQVATSLADLAFDDVHAAVDRPLASGTDVTVELLTYDGMQIDIRLESVSNRWRAQLRASTLIPAPRLPVHSSDKFYENAVEQLASSAVRAQIETLNRRWRGYVFDLDSKRLEAIVVRATDLLPSPAS